MTQERIHTCTKQDFADLVSTLRTLLLVQKRPFSWSATQAVKEIPSNDGWRHVVADGNIYLTAILGPIPPKKTKRSRK